MEASRSEVDESFLCSESVPAVGLVKENEASLDLQYHPVRQQIPSVPQTRSSIYNTVSPRTSLPVEFPLLASSSSDSSHSVTTSDLSKTADDVLGPLQPDHSTKAFLHIKTNCRNAVVRTRHSLTGDRSSHSSATKRVFAHIKAIINRCDRTVQSFGKRSHRSKKFAPEYGLTRADDADTLNKHPAPENFERSLHSSGPSQKLQRPMRPLNQALKNCQQTYIVSQTFCRLLTNFLEQEPIPSSQEHDRNEDFSVASSVSHLSLHELMHELDREQNLKSPQRVHQMKRISTWSCDEIQDELRDLQIATVHGGRLQAKAERLFVKRWKSLPIKAFDDVEVHYNGPGNLEDVDVDSLVEGHIAHDPVERAMIHWPVLETRFREGQAAYRDRTGESSHYGLDAATMLAMIDNGPALLEVRRKTAARCQSNVQTVKAAFYDLRAELNEEMSRRSTEGRLPLGSGRNSDPKIHLLRAEAALEKMQEYLKRADYAVGKLAKPKPQRTGKPPGKHDFRYEERVLQDWGSLGLNAFGALVTLTLEEVVEILARKPLEEDVVTGPNCILANIPRYLRPL